MESKTAAETTHDLLQCLPISKFFEDKSRSGDLSRGVDKTSLNRSWTLAGEAVPYLYAEHPVAIKYAVKPERIKQEYELLSQLRNPVNVVSVYSWFDRDNQSTTNLQTPSFFVMELGECSLYDFLHGKYATTFKTAKLESANSQYSEKELSSNYTMNRCLVWLCQMASGMECLHNNGILHRDVKSDNVLLFDGCQTCKICDLDFGRKEDEERKTKGVGTNPYAAPEVDPKVDPKVDPEVDPKVELVESKVKVAYSYPADYYSFGVLMSECLSRMNPIEGPFTKIPTESAFGSAADQRYKFKTLKQCIEKQQSLNPAERINFTLLKSKIKASCLPTPEDEQLTELPLPSKDDKKIVRQVNAFELDHRGSGKKTASKPRLGRTIFYNVALEDAGELRTDGNACEEAGPIMDNKSEVRISELLRVNRLKINSRVVKSLKFDNSNSSCDVTRVKHSFSIHVSSDKGHFCRIEHVIHGDRNEAEDAVYKYCCEDVNHLKWFENLFVDEPDEPLEKLRFSVYSKLDSLDILPIISAGSQPD